MAGFLKKLLEGRFQQSSFLKLSNKRTNKEQNIYNTEQLIIENGIVIQDQNSKPLTKKYPLSQKSKRDAEIVVAPLPKIGRPQSTKAFLEWLQCQHYSKRTIYTYSSEYRFWQQIAKNQGKTIYYLTVVDVEHTIKKFDITTAKKKVAFLKTLARWYLRSNHSKLHLELQKVAFKKGKSRVPKYKSNEEFVRLRELCVKLVQQRDRRGLWIGLMLLCGLRISEIQSCEVSGTEVVKVLGKGNKERVVACPDFMIELLKCHKKKGRGGYQLCQQAIDYILRKDFQLTNLHSLRHTFATFLRRNTKLKVDLDDIQKLLGHSSVATTQIYAKTEIPKGITDVIMA